MSTILKALKRIDQTTPPPEDLQSWPPKIDTKETIKSRVHRIWMHRKLYLALFITAVIIGAGWFAYSQKHLFTSKLSSGKTAQKELIYQAKIDLNRLEGGDSAGKRTPPLNRQNVGSGANPAKSRTGAATPAGPSRQMPLPQKTLKKPIFSSSKKNQPPRTRSTTESQIPRSQSAGSKKSIQSRRLPFTAAPAQKIKSKPARASRSYRRLEDAKLKLQAIAWSNKAAQRIAVINGRVIREGESVGGFTVNQIRQEDVIINDGTESWRLEFGLK